MIKVRYNLSRGKNYMKWKVDDNGVVKYYSPDEVQLVMNICTLKNNRKTAEKIFCGANKEVCAWIECEYIKVIKSKRKYYKKMYNLSEISYNPKTAPYWYDTIFSNSIDGFQFTTIITLTNTTYVLNRVDSEIDITPDEKAKYLINKFQTEANAIEFIKQMMEEFPTKVSIDCWEYDRIIYWEKVLSKLQPSKSK